MQTDDTIPVKNSVYDQGYDFGEKELIPFLVNPKAMPVGTSGKKGYLRLGFELDSDGKSILRDWERHVPLIVQQALYFDECMPEMPCVYILSSGGPNVDGDRFEQIITLKKDSFAFISTGAATKIAQMKYNFSAMVQSIELDEGAYLEFLPEQMIPCARSRYFTTTTLKVHPSATVFYSEIYMGGRKFYKEGENFDYDLLIVETTGERPGGKLLFKDKAVIKPSESSPSQIGIMNQDEIFANAIIMTPEDKAAEIYDTLKSLVGIRSKGFIVDETCSSGKAAFEDEYISFGINHLSNSAGLMIRITGKNSGLIKRSLRFACSVVRQAIKGVCMPDEFPWR